MPPEIDSAAVEGVSANVVLASSGVAVAVALRGDGADVEEAPTDEIVVDGEEGNCEDAGIMVGMALDVEGDVDEVTPVGGVC